MSGGNFTVPNTPNNYATPYGGASVSAQVDTGATQDSTTLEIDMGGTAGVDAIDVIDSQDGTTFFYVTTIQGGAGRVILTDVARYLKVVRQAGTSAIVVQWGKTTSSAGGGTASLINGGNATGPISAGTLDGSASTFGGLSAASATTVQSGTTAALIVNSGTTGDVDLGTGAGGTDANAKTIRVGTGAAAKTLLMGSSNTSSSAQVLIGATGGLGLGVAAALGSGQVLIDSPTTGSVLIGTTNTTAIRIGNAGSGVGIGVGAPAAPGTTIDTGAAGALLVGNTNATTLTLGGTASAVATASWNVAAGGTLTLGGGNVANTTNIATGTGGKTVHIADGAGANVLSMGSNTGAASTVILFGSGGASIGVSSLVASQLTVDVPAAGAISIGATNATSMVVGGVGSALATLSANVPPGGTIGIGNGVSAGSAINIATGASTYTVNIGTTGAGVKTINIGTVASINVISIAGATSQLGFYGATAVVQASRSGQIGSIAGTPGTTMPTVGGAFSQSAIDNNFATCATKINNLETIIHNLGLSA